MEEEVAGDGLRVGASATDDASTSRLVKQLFGASIRCRVSLVASPLRHSARTRGRSLSLSVGEIESIDEKCVEEGRKSCTWKTRRRSRIGFNVVRLAEIKRARLLHEVTRAKHARLRFEASGTWYRSITRVRLARDIGRQLTSDYFGIGDDPATVSALRRGPPHTYDGTLTDSAYDMLKIRMLDYIGDTGFLHCTHT
ncbi:uncharacterized protein LOC105433359 [Pogonomyrmex barbatus]|uniref:Uncharacterized protein LOC105433359 n=1 Tax=Pogonomyrmex barbatus TaxID=144034 RepID=A0A6I9X2Y3_9HYME|nr:uncharacterized protein LOC105433359 [Pogonomyrmex barbatus]